MIHEEDAKPIGPPPAGSPSPGQPPAFPQGSGPASRARGSSCGGSDKASARLVTGENRPSLEELWVGWRALDVAAPTREDRSSAGTATGFAAAAWEARPAGPRRLPDALA